MSFDCFVGFLCFSAAALHPTCRNSQNMPEHRLPFATELLHKQSVPSMPPTATSSMSGFTDLSGVAQGTGRF